MTGAGRLDRQVRALIADVVVALIHRGLIENTATMVSKATLRLGLPPDELNRAAKRHQRGEGLDSVPQATWIDFDPLPVSQRAQRAEIVHADALVRADRIGPGGCRELQCGGCGDWKTATAFRPLDRPGAFTARCASCLEGFVPVEATARVDTNIGRVDMRLVVDPESNLVGLACASCDHQFTSAQVVEGETFLTHHECPK